MDFTHRTLGEYGEEIINNKVNSNKLRNKSEHKLYHNFFREGFSKLSHSYNCVVLYRYRIEMIKEFIVTLVNETYILFNL